MIRIRNNSAWATFISWGKIWGDRPGREWKQPSANLPWSFWGCYWLPGVPQAVNSCCSSMRLPPTTLPGMTSRISRVTIDIWNWGQGISSFSELLFILSHTPAVLVGWTSPFTIRIWSWQIFVSISDRLQGKGYFWQTVEVCTAIECSAGAIWWGNHPRFKEIFEDLSTTSKSIKFK